MARIWILMLIATSALALIALGVGVHELGSGAAQPENTGSITSRSEERNGRTKARPRHPTLGPTELGNSAQASDEAVELLSALLQGLRDEDRDACLAVLLRIAATGDDLVRAVLQLALRQDSWPEWDHEQFGVALADLVTPLGPLAERLAHALFRHSHFATAAAIWERTGLRTTSLTGLRTTAATDDPGYIWALVSLLRAGVGAEELEPDLMRALAADHWTDRELVLQALAESDGVPRSIALRLVQSLGDSALPELMANVLGRALASGSIVPVEITSHLPSTADPDAVTAVVRGLVASGPHGARWALNEVRAGRVPLVMLALALERHGDGVPDDVLVATANRLWNQGSGARGIRLLGRVLKAEVVESVAVDLIVAALRSSDPAHVRAAVSQLRLDRAVSWSSELVAALWNVAQTATDEWLRARASHMLAGRSEDRDELQLLIVNEISSARPAVLYVWLNALGRLGPVACSSVEHIEVHFTSESRSVRTAALIALARIDEAALLERIALTLEREDPLSSEGLRALGEVATDKRSAISYVRQALTYVAVLEDAWAAAFALRELEASCVVQVEGLEAVAAVLERMNPASVRSHWHQILKILSASRCVSDSLVDRCERALTAGGLTTAAFRNILAARRSS